MMRPTIAAVLAAIACPIAFAQSKLPEPKFPAEQPLAIPKPKQTLTEAVAAFQQAKDGQTAKFADAKRLFDRAAKDGEGLNAEQTAAWVYCRLRLATEQLNRTTDSASARDAIVEIEDALATVPDHAGLHDAAKDILAAARKRVGTGRSVKTPAAIQPIEAGWQAVEGKNFRVKYRENKAFAGDVLAQAESLRTATFELWSGPPGSDWSPKCDIVIHETAKDFARSTGLDAATTGRAEVRLNDGSAASRRIDLRLDDDTLTEAALPRELASVVFVDLFPKKAPPKWAELGMAVRATSEVERARYAKTIRRCAKDGELLPVEKVLAAADVPAKDATSFHVESAGLVEFLVKQKGEKTFTAFVREMQRYGYETSLRRQYGLDSIRDLEESWMRSQLK